MFMCECLHQLPFSSFPLSSLPSFTFLPSLLPPFISLLSFSLFSSLPSSFYSLPLLFTQS